jgi:nucleoside phosphorylase
LDHVFANSDTTRGNGLGTWDQNWFPYAHSTGSYKSNESSDPLWGMFRVVSVKGATRNWTVLLFRSNAHLQYQPYIAGLRAMVQTMVADARPCYLYSIGTAGGGALNQNLGDPVVTNGAQLLPGAPPNDTDAANGQTFSCSTWTPPVSLYADAQKLMFPLSKVVTSAELTTLFSHFAHKYDAGSLALSDVLNAPLQPTNLGAPIVRVSTLPLNTSCDFAMAPAAGSTQFSAYEEDDAAVGQAATLANVPFAFIRNVSDTVVPDQTASGAKINESLRQKWAQTLYDRYSLITATNGALATWAAIAAS